MRSYLDLVDRFPIALTAKEADERRDEFVVWLRELADAIETGAFKFNEGWKFNLNVVRDD